MSPYLIPADIPAGKWTGEIETVERRQLATYLRFRGIKKALAVQPRTNCPKSTAPLVLIGHNGRARR